MKELVFLLEEESAKAMLESLLPRMLNQAITPRLIAFQGKQDLEKQMIKRMRGYLNPNARFIVLRDLDSNPDCQQVKVTLLKSCELAGRLKNSVVRIACRELESFYLGDLEAVEQGLSLDKLAKHQGTAKFREPDNLGNPSKELAVLTGNRYQKVSGSRAIGKFLDLNNERSTSFKNLIQGIRRMEIELMELPGNSSA